MIRTSGGSITYGGSVRFYSSRGTSAIGAWTIGADGQPTPSRHRPASAQFRRRARRFGQALIAGPPSPGVTPTNAFPASLSVIGTAADAPEPFLNRQSR